MTDWLDDDYVRVYCRALKRDHPAIWRDKAALGWFVALLDRAQAVWPNTADLPRGLPADTLAALVAAGLVDQLEADEYRVHGVDRLRAHLAHRGLAGGRARAASGQRNASGQLVAGTSERPAKHAHAGGSLEPANGEMLEPANDQHIFAGEPATVSLGRPANQRFDSIRGEPSKDSTRVESTSRPPAPAREDRGSLAPQTIQCDDYRAHQTQHVRIAGVGWKCPPCEKARAEADLAEGRGFRDRVKWPPAPQLLKDEDGTW